MTNNKIFALIAFVALLCFPLRGMCALGGKPVQTVYYVVAGSYSTLEEAKQYNYSCPDGLEGNIYSAKVNGKTVYRVCIGIYRRKADAQKYATSTHQYTGKSYWVWTSKGLARLVERVNGSDGNPMPISPR